jgi:hypothetical protein
LRSWLTRFLVVTATLASATGGSVAAAAARTHHPAARHAAHASVSARTGEDPSSEGADSDAAQQAAACQKAGIDPTADNVNYDGTTGVCSLDTSGNTQQ